LEKGNSRELVILRGRDQLNKVVSFLIALVVIFCFSIFFFFLYFVNTDLLLRVVGTIAAGLIVIAWLCLEYRIIIRQRSAFEPESPIRRLILMTRDGEREKEWQCEGMNSFLIGKGTTAGEVDIELGDTHYNEYISHEHAALNFSDGFWYISDLNSLNGVGIKKKGEECALRLKPMISYKIDEGDIIYISKAKILVR
jgi:hypothetical protein